MSLRVFLSILRNIGIVHVNGYRSCGGSRQTRPDRGWRIRAFGRYNRTTANSDVLASTGITATNRPVRLFFMLSCFVHDYLILELIQYFFVLLEATLRQNNSIILCPIYGSTIFECYSAATACIALTDIFDEIITFCGVNYSVFALNQNIATLA